MRTLYDKYNSFEEIADIPSALQFGDLFAIPSPRVSVIMPVYRRPELFKIALHSVLDQSYTEPYEVIVVDNNETADSPNLDVVRRVGSNKVLYYHNSKNLGMFGNWNRGIQLSRAPYVTFCHDDDMLLPGALERLMSLQPMVGKSCILSTFNQVNASGDYLGTLALERKFLVLRPRSYYPLSLFGQVLGNPSTGVGSLYDKGVLLELGGYDKSYYPCSDYALNLNYAHHYGAIVNNIPTCSYRIFENESIQAYDGFAKQGRLIHEQMDLCERMPSWFARRLIEAQYLNTQSYAERVWAGIDTSIKRMRFQHRAILWFVRNWDRVHKYRFIWQRNKRV